MKTLFFLLLSLFILYPAQAAQIFPGPTIFRSTIKPNATGQDMNDSSSRWDVWVGQLNTPYGAGFAYIDSSGYLQRLAYGTSSQYYRADGTIQTLDTSVVPENGNVYFTDERAQDAVGSMVQNSTKVSLTYVDGTPSLTADIIAGSIVNADISASAAIAYSKLNLAGSIVNADISASAAIAYSKLSLAASIANSDLATMAQNTVKGRANGAGTGAPVDLSSSQLNTIVGSSDLTLTKALAASATTDSSTGDIDTLTTTNIANIRLTGAAPVLRGIANGADGKLLVISNASGVDVSVKNQDANPTAANRIITGTGGDLTLKDTASIFLAYDATTSRWRIVGGSGSSSGGGSSTTPTVQKFTSGSGTYTTPANVKYIVVTMTGGGGGGIGGGSSQSTGTAGGNSTFGTSLLTANGGSAGAGGAGTQGAAGGSATVNSPATTVFAFTGGEGGSSGYNNSSSALYLIGGSGGQNFFGGGGRAGTNGVAGGAGVSGTGAGGGGGGCTGTGRTPGTGGGAGGALKAIINSPSSTYSYAVGAAGSAGTGNDSNGGAGGSGLITVEEFY